LSAADCQDLNNIDEVAMIKQRPNARTIQLAVILACGCAVQSQPARGGEVSPPDEPRTVALWLFDEQIGLYPSSLLIDAGPEDYSLVLGRGGQMVPGKFGHALAPQSPQPLAITNRWLEDQQEPFGLRPSPPSPGRSVEPMTWHTATFCALMTAGENHLRRMEFANATDTGLNLGDFRWTVEFWFRSSGPADDEGTVLEIGAGPRGENDLVTRLSLAADGRSFRLVNAPSKTRLKIPTDASLIDGQWHHVAFCYDPAELRVTHWIDGELQAPAEPATLAALPHGDEAYASLGRDGLWERPLTGALDEFRISRGCRYQGQFDPPGSFSKAFGADRTTLKLQAGPPLLFPGGRPTGAVVELGNRKHMLIDDALFDHREGVAWVANPPAVRELVMEQIRGHLSVIQDSEGVIRLYGAGPQDALVVFTSTDGIHFSAPDLGEDFHGARNVVISEAVGLGEVFIDPNAPPSGRWKYVSGIRNGGIFVFSSPDGYRFTRHETSALPFAAGSQSNVFYDDQRQLYVGYHRSDYGAASATGHESERRFVVTEVKDLLESWPFEPVTAERTAAAARQMRIKSHLLDPWWLDNGPLAPGGFGIEFPVVFAPDPEVDPPQTDIYVPKAGKYAWAPDVYVGFPHFYFHYWDVDDPARAELGLKENNRGSGMIEVQTVTSRDGLSWTRYPRPAYVSPGRRGDRGPAFMTGVAQGLIRRGDEIWQYAGYSPDYHSAWQQGAWGGRPGLFRTTQRLDGFVSADFDYRGGRLVSRPLRFTGSQLRLNVDTQATGYLQLGLLDELGQPIPGFETAACVYVNGDFIDEPVRWLHAGSDVSELAGKTVRVEIAGRGAKLYALQFVEVDGE